MAKRRWAVETRVTTYRTYFVSADNEKDAEAATVGAYPDLDGEENEETLSIKEVPTKG